MPVELTVVVPVYNEAALVEGAVTQWLDLLDRLRIDYAFVLYDDGSTDSTADILARLAARHPRVAIRRQSNRGHGPTILRGYREAAGAWVFQTDSDGEMDTAAFEALWRSRADYDLLVGRRVDRQAPLARRLITAVSRHSVRVAFGPGLHDVNSPYRLVRAARLRDVLPLIPDDTFAPNVLLSGLAVRHGWRVHERPVRCAARRTASGSLGGTRALRAAVRALAQTLRAAWRGPRPRGA
ncbi:MAG: glycosyltransferase family 2 protein [Vicinamibacterales bacterium]